MIKGNNKKLKEQLKELQKAYDMAMREIDILNAKRTYWEKKFKQLEIRK